MIGDALYAEHLTFALLLAVLFPPTFRKGGSRQ